MTIPVTSLTNLYGGTANSTVAGVGGESSKSFTQVMGNVTNGNKQDNTQQQKQGTVQTNRDTKQENSHKVNPSKNKVDKNTLNKSTDLNKKVKVENGDELNETALEQINEKAEALITSIADKLNVSEEDVIAAMELLGINNVDLLNPDMLSQLVVNISGEEDMMSLVMDEELYGNLKELLQTVDSIKTELSESFGISLEELPNVLEQASDMIKAEQTNQLPEAEIELLVEQGSGDTEGQKNLTAEAMGNQRQNSEEAVVEVSSKVPTYSETEMEKTSVNAQETSDWEIEETVEKPLESAIQQPGAESKNMEQGHQENGHTFLQSLTETAATIAENANVNAADASFTEILYPQDTESIMKQMVDYMKLHVSANVSEMEIQLQPASLGTVNLNIASKNGAITAQFTAQNETVKEALESQIVQLRESLDERGIKVEAIEVTVASHEFERNLEQGEQEARDSEQAEAARKTGRRRIVLNQEESEETDELEMDELDEADRIQVELMQQRGNTVSLMA